MEIKSYELGNLTAQYLITEEGRIGLMLLPAGTEGKQAKNWELDPGNWDVRCEYIRDFRPGNLVQLHLRHHSRSRGNGVTMKYSESTDALRFQKQWLETEGDTVMVKTLLRAEEGYEVLHTLGYYRGTEALWSDTEFINHSGGTLELEMLSSFCLENLSPYQKDNDQTGKLALHRFLGSWALEGRHVCTPIEDLGLQKAWCAPFLKSERFGSVGSWTTQKYFPQAAVEDLEYHILWAAALETVSSWQMELTRDGDTLSFSGGLADMETGAWMKRIEDGESFRAPRARLTAAEGDIQDACQKLLSLQKKAAKEYGEKGLPIIFNEYCSSWGNPTQEKELEYAGILQDKGIGYLVIDAGWTRGSHEQWGNGEWLPDEEKFPDLKGMNRKIREMGLIPGIWFEFEATTEGSRVFAKEYDHMHLQRDGQVIRFGKDRSFWDFRREDVRGFLKKRVIDFLREYDFGYLKVDYNGNIGLGCDGAESLGEGLRQQMEAVKAFFLQIHEELPELIVENCASGAHRMEPSMMSVTGVTSFSDAHEAREIPYIAGNQQALCLPSQNLIWAVLRQDDEKQRLEYSLTAGFLGRLCLSGDIESLDEEQWRIITNGLEIYRKAEQVIIDGTTRVYRSRQGVIRHPEGLQVVVRSTDKEMWVVCHGFAEAEKDCIQIPLSGVWSVADGFGAVSVEISEHSLLVKDVKEWSGFAFLLKQN